MGHHVHGISFDHSTALQARLHELVPGGAHTFAKGSDQYPEGMAPVLARGRGARVWDVDGNEFVEYGMGLRSVTLGHGYEPVLDAVKAALDDGISFTRPTELELAAAEDFLALVPGADMVKFCKNASDATSTAIRLARAATASRTSARRTGSSALSRSIPGCPQPSARSVVPFPTTTWRPCGRCSRRTPARSLA
jgi:glutamate-1-semialdehyde 2,1-aminomutase